MKMMQISKKLPGSADGGDAVFARSTIIARPGVMRERSAMQLSSMQLMTLVLVGGLIGTFSGMLGIGGGVVVIPILMTFYHFTYKQAVGTSLGMLLPPIGIFAFMEYYRTHEVSLTAAMLLGLGFAVGAYLGGRLVTSGKVPEHALRVMFGFFLLYVATSILFRTDLLVRPTINTLLIVGGAAAAYVGFRVIGQQWGKKYDVGETYRAQLQVPMAPDYEI
jgi:uncharacterized membrane protein YfcA